MRYTAHIAPSVNGAEKHGRREVSMTKKSERDDSMERACAFCELGTRIPLSTGEESDVICEKHGIVSADHCCRSFRYDLLKRSPKEKRPLPKMTVISLDD